jgi:hypothetical protein
MKGNVKMLILIAIAVFLIWLFMFAEATTETNQAKRVNAPKKKVKRNLVKLPKPYVEHAFSGKLDYEFDTPEPQWKIPEVKHWTSYHEYIQSPEWRELRKIILDRDGNKCTQCGNTVTLQVHHIHYENLFHERKEDLITLCNDCHEATHATEEKYYFKPKRKAA